MIGASRCRSRNSRSASRVRAAMRTTPPATHTRSTRTASRCGGAIRTKSSRSLTVPLPMTERHRRTVADPSFTEILPGPLTRVRGQRVLSGRRSGDYGLKGPALQPPTPRPAALGRPVRALPFLRPDRARKPRGHAPVSTASCPGSRRRGCPGRDSGGWWTSPWPGWSAASEHQLSVPRWATPGQRGPGWVPGRDCLRTGCGSRFLQKSIRPFCSD